MKARERLIWLVRQTAEDMGVPLKALFLEAHMWFVGSANETRVNHDLERFKQGERPPNYVLRFAHYRRYNRRR